MKSLVIEHFDNFRCEVNLRSHDFEDKQTRPTCQLKSSVSARVEYSVDWIRLLVQRYNQTGPHAIGDQRHHNPGQARLLTPDQETTLGMWLDAAAPRG